MNKYAQRLADLQEQQGWADATVELLLRAFVLNDEKGPEFIQFVKGVANNE